MQLQVAKKAQHYTKLFIILHRSYDQGPTDPKDLRATTDMIMKQWIIITEQTRLSYKTDTLLVGEKPF